MWSPMIGQVNVYNALAASAAGYARDCPLGPIAKGIFDLARVPGRFERVECGQPFTVAVDYAHTDDALRNLTALAHAFVARAGLNGKVITLFGCGGAVGVVPHSPESRSISVCVAMLNSFLMPTNSPKTS